MSLALLGCSTEGGGGTEASGPGTGDETETSTGTSDSTDTTPTTSATTETTTDPGVSSTETTDPGDEPGTGTSGDPSTGTSGEPPVDACHLADDNVECDSLVDRSGQVPISEIPMLPPAGWIEAGDTPVLAVECDIYAQDCPAGQKCTAYGAQWSDVACFPLVQFPAKEGEYCGPDDQGADTCEAGSICQFSSLVGSMICQPLCGCSETNPTCGENERCRVYNGGVLPMCERLCDPFDLGTCEAGEVCVKGSWTADFFCGPDTSGDKGVFHDPCKSLNECDPGYSCEYAEFVPDGCGEGVASCCTPLCTLEDPVCPEGSHCLEYFGGFGLEAPACLEDVGYCVSDEAPLVDGLDELRVR